MPPHPGRMTEPDPAGLKITTPSHLQTLVFELDPAYVTKSGRPSDRWLSALQHGRDDPGEAPAIKPLRLPTRASQHPVLSRIFKIELLEGAPGEEWHQRLEAAPGVIWVEAAPVRWTCAIPGSGRDGTDAIPNDPYYPLQWSLHRIQAAAAWDITHGDTGVTIAVVDVGVDLDHDDLFSQRWINQAEAAGQPGIDDDGNGFIDDLNGWDFQDDDPDPRPEGNDRHGTHVAGIAAAAVDNGYGIAGVGFNCRVMAVRAGIGNAILSGFEGIIYAAASGADVINLSWGSGDPSNVERITTEYATEQGAMIVAAAGNLLDGESHYPSAYDGVLGVAAVTEGDIMASYSNYGRWVEISAPGTSIISTIPGGFGIQSGTSMATPMVAGAAALVKSICPDWDSDRIRLQLSCSADPIDDLNPRHAGVLGAGRLNLFRALTDLKPGFELVSFEVDDRTYGDGDGIIDPNERIEITMTITNRLTLPAVVTATFTSPSHYIDIIEGTADFGEVTPGRTADNADSPFQAEISSNATSGRRISCSLDLDDLHQSLPLTLVVRSPYADHDTGNVVFTITDFGALGYMDYLQLEGGEGVCQGFRYPAGGLSALFHGSLMIGAPPNKVSDCAFGDPELSRFDFASSCQGFVLHTGASGAQEGHAAYDDVRAERPLRVTVEQNSFSFADPPDDDYVIISYTVRNGGSRIDNLYVGLYLDWDVVQSGNNLCCWDGEAGVGWVEYARGGFPVFGTALLDAAPGFHTAVDNRDVHPSIVRKWSDQVKLEFMRSGFSQASGEVPNDWSQLIGAGPTPLESGDSIMVTFAILAGDDPADLKANVQAARERWDAQTGSLAGGYSPERFELIAAYPSPFNGSLTLRCRTDSPGVVDWMLFDPTGRPAFTGGNFAVRAGRFAVPIAVPELPSGRYLVVLNQDGQQLTVPVTLVR